MFSFSVGCLARVRHRTGLARFGLRRSRRPARTCPKRSNRNDPKLPSVSGPFPSPFAFALKKPGQRCCARPGSFGVPSTSRRRPSSSASRYLRLRPCSSQRAKRSRHVSFSGGCGVRSIKCARSSRSIPSRTICASGVPPPVCECFHAEKPPCVDVYVERRHLALAEPVFAQVARRIEDGDGVGRPLVCPCCGLLFGHFPGSSCSSVYCYGDTPDGFCCCGRRTVVAVASVRRRVFPRVFLNYGFYHCCW